MRRLLFACLVLILAGCQGVVGPRQRRFLTTPIDDPCLTPGEQKERERDRSPLPEGNPAYGPRTYSENPALKGP